MIRPEAARKLAANLLSVYLTRGMISEELIECTAGLILGAVAIDELRQDVEAAQREAA